MKKSKSKILLIEDDIDIHEAISSVLSQEGYIVLSATNGMEGLNILSQNASRPDLILLDLMMPVMDGNQFLSLLKGDDRRIPIIVMSAEANLHSERTSSDLNSSFIKKPIDLEPFISEINNIISQTN